MEYKVVAIEMISAPNSFAYKNPNEFHLIGGNAKDLWFQLNISDALGERRYIPTAPMTMKVIFQRGDGVNFGQAGTTISKTAVQDADDKSLFKVSVSAADSLGVTSGTVKFELTEVGVKTTWVQNWFLKRELTDGGH